MKAPMFRKISRSRHVSEMSDSTLSRKWKKCSTTRGRTAKRIKTQQNEENGAHKKSDYKEHRRKQEQGRCATRRARRHKKVQEVSRRWSTDWSANRDEDGHNPACLESHLWGCQSTIHRPTLVKRLTL